jgi:NADP-dependent 3-hydroxy acid dehydrogenase YdfG
MRLEGKTALITGAGSGVGRATAKLFHEEGASIVVAGRDASKLKETIAGLSRATAVSCDVTEPTQVELTIDNWNKLIRTNLDGAFYCIRAVLPQMIARKDGVIVNTNSVSGKRAYPLAGAGYAAGKFGLHALAGCLASEELESGIRVSSVYPGEIDTPILNERPTPVTAEQRAKILKSEDVANAILFVATLPPHVSVPELIIKPTSQLYF